MIKNFKHVLTKSVFYDPQSDALFIKRDSQTAAMLVKGIDLGFDGDKFGNDEEVMVVDVAAAPYHEDTHWVKVAVGCYKFSGTVSEVKEYLAKASPCAEEANADYQSFMLQLGMSVRNLSALVQESLAQSH